MRQETADILAFLDAYVAASPDEAAMKMASDFRSRRVEKGLTRRAMASRSGVPLGNLARFEQKGLISLKDLLKLATSLGYRAELRNVFAEPKFHTMAELQQIRKNTGKKKAYPSRNKTDD